MGGANRRQSELKQSSLKLKASDLGFRIIAGRRCQRDSRLQLLPSL
jgi:hypothetical protein